jgi:hypothetical protein
MKVSDKKIEEIDDMLLNLEVMTSLNEGMEDKPFKERWNEIFRFVNSARSVLRTMRTDENRKRRG